jgi:voltage-gated potassium channel Kch
VILALSTKSVLMAFPTPGLSLLDKGLSLLAVLILTALVLTQVFRKGRITLHRVQGAVAAYLLLGFAWAIAYEFSLLLDPGAIRFPDASGVGFLLVPRLLYFSFVTLTTVGYGDIVPVHPAVRSLAVTEALIGQLYPAVLIARLVSLEIVSRNEPR